MSRDRTVGDTFYIAFTTRAFATGVPTVLSGTPVISAYEDGGLTQITAGITLGVDHDGVVGLNMVTVVATGGNGFESGKDYNLVITTGTVGGVSVVGEVIGQFSLNLSAAAKDLANGTDGLGAIKTDSVAILIDTSEIGTAGAGLTNIGTIATCTTVTNQVVANMTSISGDATAADNLEATYDGTGYVSPQAPATQDQVGNLSTGSAAISVVAESATITVGTQVNTFTAADTLNGVYHEITDVTGQIDFYYQYDVGGNGVATSLTFTGRLQGSNDDLDVYAWNWGDASWDQIGNIQGSNSTNDGDQTFNNILVKHTGAGSDLGKVRLRAFKASGLTSATMYIDQSYVSYAVVAQSVGYDGGQVWVDTTSGVTGTESFVNGVADNSVNSFANALTIASNVGLHRYSLSSDSSVTLAASFTNSVITGEETALALGGQDCSGSHFTHCSVSGIALSGTAEVNFDGCELGAITVNESHFKDCGLTSTITLGSVASGILLDECYSISTLAKIDFGAAGTAHDGHIVGYKGYLEIVNFNVGADVGDTLTITGTGNLTIAATCDSGTINIYGVWKITDNSGGAVTVILDDIHTEVDLILVDTAVIGAAGAGLTDLGGMSTSMKVEIEDAVWDAELTGAKHNNTSSSGKKLRTLATVVIRNETAQGSGTGNNQIQLDAGASATDGAYDPSLIAIIGGTGAGQTRLILQYDGTSKTATVDRNWKVNPDATSEFNILADAGRNHVNEGLAQGGTTNTVTLNALATSNDDVYVGQIVFIRSGTGEDQSGTVISYNGTTKVATVDRNWSVVPDSTSGYTMIPASPVILASTTHTGAIIPTVTNVTLTATTTDVTNQVSANVTAISGDSAAADSLEASLETLVTGTATGTPTTTTMADSALTEATDDHFIGRVIIWRTGALKQQATVITDYDGATKLLTFTATTNAASSGDAYVIV